MKIALITAAIGVFMCAIALVAINQVNAKQVTIADPWTVKAATFNPAGVKWAGGVTTGGEMTNKVMSSWAREIQVEAPRVLAEANDAR
jgi:hypothetical protein